MGTLSSSIKQIKVPYVFDWEHGIAVHAMQWNRASSLAKGKVSCFFFFQAASGTWCFFSSYGRDGNSKLVFVQRRQDTGLVTMDTTGT